MLPKLSLLKGEYAKREGVKTAGAGTCPKPHK